MEYIKQYEILIKKAKDDYNTAKIVFENIKDINIEIDDDLIILNDYAVEARYDYIGETFDNIVETTEKVEDLIKKVENMIK